MIITNLIGGLGNQLFQFAAGHAAAARRGAELRVAVDMFEGYSLHQGYELSRVFAVSPREAHPSEMRHCLGPWRRPVARRVLGRVVRGTIRSGHAAFQPTVTYWSGIRDLGDAVYLQGYWQSERYFEDTADALRAALVFRSPPSPENQRWLDRIENCQSVGMHVRRGDYLSSVKNAKLYAVCTADYYRAAVALVRQQHADARFFVFSDEPDWARGLFDDSRDIVEVVNHNRGTESYNDLRLMSSCRHNIVANSTFSWWAAWLGQRPGKLVVAPQRWLLPAGLDADMVPERWVRI